MTYVDGGVYEGEFKENVRHGEGVRFSIIAATLALCYALVIVPLPTLALSGGSAHPLMLHYLALPVFLCRLDDRSTDGPTAISSRACL